MYMDYVNKSLYAGDAEVKAIGIAIQPEFDRQRAQVERNFKQRWIKLADEEGIRDLESERGIIPDIARDSLDDRKERLLELNRRREPFTEIWLDAELFRRTNSEAIKARIDGLKLSIQIKVPFGAEGEAFINSRTVRELMPWLRGAIPCGVFLHLHQVSLPEAYGTRKYHAGFAAEKISETYVSSREVSSTASNYAARVYIERIEVEYYG